MINLLSKTGLGRSGHVRFQTFGPIWHVSGSKMVFWRNDIMILHHFCWRSLKIKLFWLKTLIFNQRYFKNPQKYVKIGFPRNSCGSLSVNFKLNLRYFHWALALWAPIVFSFLWGWIKSFASLGTSGCWLSRRKCPWNTWPCIGQASLECRFEKVHRVHLGIPRNS